MIPNYKGKFIQDVDFSSLKYPPNRFLSRAFDKISNHDYFDMRGYDWDSYKMIYEVEKNIIECVDNTAKNAKQFEEFIEYIVENDELNSSELLGIEAGVASITFALSALGGAPLVSCRGHPKNTYPYSRYPMVVFYSDKDIAKDLVKLVSETSLGFLDIDTFDGYRGLMLQAKNVVDMMEFSQKIYSEKNN